METSFHLSLPCTSIVGTKKFYIDIISANLGRYANNWVDINLFGHQVTFTQVGKFDFNNPKYIFEGKLLSSFHFGIILDIDTWGKIYSKLNSLNIEMFFKRCEANRLKKFNDPSSKFSFGILKPYGIFYIIENYSYQINL
jgi:extradiol dioxygenase family protein